MNLVYQPEGTLSHIILRPSDSKTLCKRSCWPGVWSGITLTSEIEHARSLAICVDCLRKWKTP